jgi:ferrochelatase
MKLGVLLLNLGGPESMKDVEGFLFNLFADPDIIRLPSFLSILQKPIAYVIAKRRAPKSSEAYQSIGGGSPIVKYTKAQADLIRDNLKARGFDAECYFAMRYWNPYTEEVLERIRKDGINTLVIVPLYPQYSISTSGSSLRLLEDIFYRNPEHWGPDKVAHTVVPAWYYRKGYLRAMARLVVQEIASFDLEAQSQGVHVLFSAHGVPQSYIEAGDPYQRHIEECVKLVSREISVVLRDDALRPPEISRDAALLLAGGGEGVGEGVGPKWEVQFHLSFQSRVGPVQWLKPYTEEKLSELGEKRGIKNLVVVPVSFVSEHIETLEEIDMEYRELAHEAGITNWRRVPTPNTDAGFINDMADMVVEALESPTLSVSESAAAMSESASDAGGGFVGSGYGGGVGGGMAGIVGFPAGVGAGSITNGAEQLTGRIAMLGLVGTTLFEFVNGGHPLLQMVGLR